MTVETAESRTPYVIEWRDGFKIGIVSVDHEHRHLFSLVAALSLESVQHTVDELLNYVVTHFTNEQRLMEESQYPAFEQHLKLHEEFGASVADFMAGSSTWDEQRVQDLRRFLNKWLIGHIMTHDLRFGKWYENRRIGQKVVASPPPPAPKSSQGFLARLFRINF